MTFRNRYLFIVFCIISVVGLLFQLRQHTQKVDDYDLPKQLSGNKTVVDITHVDRTCDCPDWSIDTVLKKPGIKDSADFIYIEPAYTNMDVPASYWAQKDNGYILRLHGEFYNGVAIPFDYTQRTDQKPEKARVFYYTQFEVIKKE